MDNKIIIINGYCATGKSTFSRKLSEILNIPCFNKDIIKETVGDGLGSDNNIVFQKGSVATFKIMLYITKQFLCTGKYCILESNFKLNEIEQVKTLLKRHNSKCLTFLFKGNFDIIFNRYKHRDSMGKRHWVHKTAEEIKENFEKGHKINGVGEYGIDNIVEIDATYFENINYEELFSIAKDFIIE